METGLPALVETLRERAKAEGFDICRITTARLPDVTGERLEQAIAADHHGEMRWMADSLARRKSPEHMWAASKSAIVLGLNYGPAVNPLDNLGLRSRGTISIYAQNRDYHDIIKGRLKTLAGWFASVTQEDVKVFVDTAPLMEKPLAEQAGVGWQGKHTNLVSREFGSWLFLGVILTTAELPLDEVEADHCGTCRACLDICPTDAFPAPYQLDARRCISYLTIELDGPIPPELRSSMGNRIYGCDDCLAVCPWNKFARRSGEIKLAARDDLASPDLDALAQLDDAAFRKKFSGSPIKRIKRGRFIRNVLTAIGNSRDPDLKKHAGTLLDDEDPVVRGAAVWAYSQLEDAATFADIRAKRLLTETDDQVRAEWNRRA